MKKEKIALFPGSFDPFTLGHYDVAVRAAKMFDKLLIVSFVNCEKTKLFSPSEQVEIIKSVFEGIDNIEVDASSELLAGYAVSRGVEFIVKGARNSTDFDYELGLSEINRRLEPTLDTVIIPARPEYAHISSTFVRELIHYGRPLEGAVPDTAIGKIRDILRNR